MNNETNFNLQHWFRTSDTWVLPEYRSPYPDSTWDETSWVRSQPHRTGQIQPGSRVYSRALTGVLDHPALAGVGLDIELALGAHYILRYDQFTIWVEQGPVNTTVRDLAAPGFLPFLPEALRRDAHRIYVDEGAHSEFTYDHLQRIAVATGVAPLDVPIATAVWLDQALGSAAEVDRPLLRTLFTAANETFITGNLSSLVHDEEVDPAVREVLADHARDEGRHHAFFSEVLSLFWPNLTEQGRRQAGIFLAESIDATLSVDVPWLTGVLESFPGLVDDPARVAQEVADSPATRAGVRNAASPTVRLLRRLGALDDYVVSDAFLQRGLIE